MAGALKGQPSQADQESVQYPFFELAKIELLSPNGEPLKTQNFVTCGQQVVVFSTLTTVSGSLPGNPISATYLVQIKDEEDIVWSVMTSQFQMSLLPKINVTWIPEASGVYSIEVFVLGQLENSSNDAIFPMAEKWGIVNVFASPCLAHDARDGVLPAGISVEVQKLGTRQFYQDRDVFLPTQLSMTRNETIDWEVAAWPSIGPNYIITQLVPPPEGNRTVVYDNYQALGIDSDMKNIQYDEFLKSADLEPYPTTGGRYFGFIWNQTDRQGVRVSAGEYEVQLTMPILIGDSGTGDDKRSRVILTSDPERFTILAGPPRILQHNLALKQSVNETELLTGQPYEYSLTLVNAGETDEYFSLLSDCPWQRAGSIVYPWYFDRTLKPGESYVITEGVSAFTRPGSQYLNGSYIFAVTDEPLDGKSDDDGVRASCIELQPNPIVLHVTARIFDGVNLVLETDKSVYGRNETVHIVTYVDNDSEKPFQLSEVEAFIHITDIMTGEPVYSGGCVADYAQYPSVQPHSRFGLPSCIPSVWQQETFDELGNGRPVAAGQYLVKATFTFPYLESVGKTISLTG